MRLCKFKGTWTSELYDKGGEFILETPSLFENRPNRQYNTIVTLKINGRMMTATLLYKGFRWGDDEESDFNNHRIIYQYTHTGDDKYYGHYQVFSCSEGCIAGDRGTIKINFEPEP
jgi:hypothetical protein